MASSDNERLSSRFGTWTGALHSGHKPFLPAIESFSRNRCPWGQVTSIDIARSPYSGPNPRGNSRRCTILLLEIQACSPCTNPAKPYAADDKNNWKRGKKHERNLKELNLIITHFGCEKHPRCLFFLFLFLEEKNRVDSGISGGVRSSLAADDPAATHPPH
jgi:hypothetical protein